MRYYVEVNFLGRDELPPQFQKFLLELKKISEGKIDVVAFNKRKKEAQNLLADWIELSGGLLFSKYLFEFEEEFVRFSENLYQDICAFDKRHSKARLQKIKNNSSVYLRRIKNLPSISSFFDATIKDELVILEKFFEGPVGQEMKSGATKDSWSTVKNLLEIDKDFEERVLVEDEETERRERDEKLIKELYVFSSSGAPIPKCLTKLQIPLDPRINQQNKFKKKLVKSSKK